MFIHSNLCFILNNIYVRPQIKYQKMLTGRKSKCCWPKNAKVLTKIWIQYGKPNATFSKSFGRPICMLMNRKKTTGKVHWLFTATSNGNSKQPKINQFLLPMCLFSRQVIINKIVNQTKSVLISAIANIQFFLKTPCGGKSEQHRKSWRKAQQVVFGNVRFNALDNLTQSRQRHFSVSDIFRTEWKLIKRKKRLFCGLGR